MVSFSSLNGEQMHGHKRLIEDVLRGELGFKGLIVSDWGGSAHASTDQRSLFFAIIIVFPQNLTPPAKSIDRSINQ
jgi:beta-glucosidase-like glycosyl hydrolase